MRRDVAPCRAERDSSISRSQDDGVGDHAADRDDAAFAGALGAERIVRRRLFLQGNGADEGKVARGRHQVIGERARQQLGLWYTRCSRKEDFANAQSGLRLLLYLTRIMREA